MELGKAGVYMFCPECGTKNEDDSLFCFECGTSLAEYLQEETKSNQVNGNQIPPQPTAPQQEQSNYLYQQNYENRQPFCKSSKPHIQRKPVSKAVIIAGIEVILAAGLLFGIYKVLSDKFSPETVAMNYWEATMAHEWGEAYEYCDFPDSDLLTKQMYVNANVRNDEIVKYKSVHITDAIDQVRNQLGDFASIFGKNGDTKNKSSADDTREYIVEYLIKGNSDKEYDYLILTKTGNKKFFIFDEWRVTSSDSWCRDLQFQIPVGASMTLNGAEISDASETTEGNWKYITIPYLFTGEYQLEVSGEGMESYRKVIDIYEYGCDDNYIELIPSEETMQTTADQAGNDIKKILESALAGKSFKEVQDLFSKESLNDGYVKDNYEKLLEIRGDGRKTGIVTLKISNIVSSIDGEANMEIIRLKTKVDRQETYRQYWSDELGKSSETITCYVTYVKEDGVWKLSEMPVSYYDF